MSAFPDPGLRRNGLYFRIGGVGRTPRPAVGAGPGRSILTDLFPTYLPIRCGFEQLDVPDPTVIATGESGWYGLAKIDVERVFGQDVYLDYAAFQITPTASADSAPNVSWGTTSGTGAAIVVGRDLPTDLGAWHSAPCTIPGVEAAAAGNVLASNVNPYAIVTTFPTGEYADTAPNKPFVPVPLGKVTYRFPRGTIFDVALVVRGSQVNLSGGGTRVLRGHVHAEIRLALTETTEGFNA